MQPWRKPGISRFDSDPGLNPPIHSAVGEGSFDQSNPADGHEERHVRGVALQYDEVKALKAKLAKKKGRRGR